MSDQPGRPIDDILMGVALPQAVRVKNERDQLVAAVALEKLGAFCERLEKEAKK